MDSNIIIVTKCQIQNGQ